MGIKRFDKKYVTPRCLWDEERIRTESEIINRYGLKNHKELWRVLFKLSKWRELAKELIVNRDPNKLDKLLNPLINMGILKEKTLESVFEITPQDVLERRLQTIVFRKGLARTIRQARHLIVHRHILVNNRVVNSPQYIVSKDEEDKITCNIVVNPSTNEASKKEKDIKEEHVKKEDSKAKSNNSKEQHEANKESNQKIESKNKNNKDQ